MQLLLDHSECRIHSSIRRSTTLGHLEALLAEQKLDTYGTTPSLLHKDDTRLTDVIIWHVEILQSLGNPPHQMRGERHVLALNV